MSSANLGYDLAVSEYSPEGCIIQLEYAGRAVQKSGTIIGLRNKDCVVLAVENNELDEFYEDDASIRIFVVDRNIDVAIAGRLADGRCIVEVARQESVKYRHHFSKPTPVDYLVDSVASYMHSFTIHTTLRPFGVCAIFAGWNQEQGPQLYKIDQSGTYNGYFACATGKAEQNAKAELEKLKLENMNTKDLVRNAGRIIHTLHDDATDFRIDLNVSNEETDGKEHFNVQPWYSLIKQTEASCHTEEGSSEEM